MGLFGGGNSSSDTTNNYDYDVTNAQGQSGAVGDNNVVTNRKTVINTQTDHGSVKAALAGMQESQKESYEFAGGIANRSFDSIDSVTEKSFDTMTHVFNKSIDNSAAARSEAFNAINASNQRVEEIYKTAGREGSAQTNKTTMMLGGLVGIALLIGVMKHA